MHTFNLPDTVTGCQTDYELAKKLFQAWCDDGIFEVTTTPKLDEKIEKAFSSSKRFFQKSYTEKSSYVSPLNYGGYIASGEEVTAGQADYSEIFTVCKDLPPNDPRVQNNWPCHGPMPWPDAEYAHSMKNHMEGVGHVGEKLLSLSALALDLPINALTDLTVDGWHHMRVLRFPARTEKTERGIGAHTDYGLLVIASQDDVGGLYIRPPVEGEHRNRNWREGESSAGMFQNEEPWTFVKPKPQVLTVFPGDIMQFLSGGRLLSTPHKVRMAAKERFALAYFHEPSFSTSIPAMCEPENNEVINYGTHFTNMFMRSYPERITTKRILEQKRLNILSNLYKKAA